ncbi:MAG TPA: response regulator, partial [Spirochaetia bacterium]|nr:response regulator [Spirochaetia bacterium]
MKPSLLIVDDEPTVRNGLIALVSERSNEWELLEPCSDGRSALETLRAGKVDVLLTDIRMPSFDGLRLTEEALRMFPNIVVIFISGYREFEYAQRAIQFGVTGFIVKPIAEEELFEVLDRARTAVQQRTSLREPNGMGSTSDAM